MSNFKVALNFNQKLPRMNPNFLPYFYKHFRHILVKLQTNFRKSWNYNKFCPIFIWFLAKVCRKFFWKTEVKLFYIRLSLETCFGSSFTYIRKKMVRHFYRGISNLVVGICCPGFWMLFLILVRFKKLIFIGNFRSLYLHLLSRIRAANHVFQVQS